MDISFAIITCSDTRSFEEDTAGAALEELIAARGWSVDSRVICRDERMDIALAIAQAADDPDVDIVLTCGGSGLSYRDVTVEATQDACDRAVPGIAEAMRYHSLSITPRGMLSRAASVLRGKTLIVNLPGSPKAVQENLEYILPSLEHGLRIAAGLDGECARH
jgi:molybdopterin adenylyltransferase